MSIREKFIKLRLEPLTIGVFLIAFTFLLVIVVAIYRSLNPAARLLPDFQSYSAGAERKTAFISFLEPIVTARNKKLLEQHAVLEGIAQKVEKGGSSSWADRRFLNKLASFYSLDDAKPESEEQVLKKLLNRVDVIPPALVVAQAANESAWGTSRFAREANNLFGQWCYKQGCGLIPRTRTPGSSHEVRSFANVDESIEGYFLNINTHKQYARLREIRQSLRSSGQSVSGAALADGLLYYSERREAYVKDIKNMMRINQKYFSG